MKEEFKKEIEILKVINTVRRKNLGSLTLRKDQGKDRISRLEDKAEKPDTDKIRKDQPKTSESIKCMDRHRKTHFQRH